jgi:hypothetical protein
MGRPFYIICPETKNHIQFVGWFWNSVYGGREEEHVYKVDNGELIEKTPMISKRDKDGRFGWDVWCLPPGVYIVIDITRPNDVDVEKHPRLIALARLSILARLIALASRILRFHLFSPYRVEIDKLIVYEEPDAEGWRYKREPLLVEKVVNLSDVKRLIAKAKERLADGDVE